MHGAVTHAPLRLRLAQIGVLFGSKNAIFVKHKYTWDAYWSCLELQFVCGLQYRQILGPISMAKLKWVRILHKCFIMCHDSNKLHLQQMSLKFPLHSLLPYRLRCHRCTHVRYCSEACRKESWDIYHHVECHYSHLLLSVGYRKNEALIINLFYYNWRITDTLNYDLGEMSYSRWRHLLACAEYGFPKHS